MSFLPLSLGLIVERCKLVQLRFSDAVARDKLGWLRMSSKLTLGSEVNNLEQDCEDLAAWAKEFGWSKDEDSQRLKDGRLVKIRCDGEKASVRDETQMKEATKKKKLQPERVRPSDRRRVLNREISLRAILRRAWMARSVCCLVRFV